MADSQRSIRFFSKGASESTFVVSSYRGTEAISRPFRYEIELGSESPNVDLDAVLGQPARLEITRAVPAAGGGRAMETVYVHGMVSEVLQLGRVAKPWVTYRAILVPRFGKLALETRSRIFVDQTIPDIFRDVLELNGLGDRDFELRLGARDYPKRQYTVQYQETDLAFLSRLCEYEGIWYRFEQGEESEKILLCDSADDYDAIAGDFPFRPVVAGESEGLDRPEEIRTFESRRRMIPGEVVLKEYNWRTPGVDLQVAQKIDAKGASGALYLFGEHYATREEGQALARIRSEEVLCRRAFFTGTGDSKHFRAGRTFELADHFRADCNRGYLLVEVEHEAAQSVEFLTKTFAGPAYRNTFVAIPSNLAFRPERVTPRPRVDGVLNAHVDAAGSGQYAEIDDQGRYKVKIPFDRSGREGGLASRYIRMAQPYAGPGMGMHFPLHKGTEVMLVHTNGDPDRPVIAGAVPNTETTSVVTGQNQTQCAIQTSGGNHMTIENQDGKQRIKMYSPTSKTKFRIGAP